MNTAVEFPGTQRLHLSIYVKSLKKSKAFYTLLFGVGPSKERPDYIKFEPENPSVNFTLAETKREKLENGFVSHLGVQVKSTEAVQKALKAFEEAGYQTKEQENTTCCYAVQDKFWVSDPDGHHWEVFVVTQADAPEYACASVEEKGQSSCCDFEQQKPKSETTCC